MPQPLFADVLRYLRRTCVAQAARDLTDADLVKRFLANREDAAFSVLVQRHGPMILGVCQRLLGDSHSAEDVFQATFLVLVRRAASLRMHKPLGSWLHGVARRIALRARAQKAARRERERTVVPMSHKETLDELTWQELRSVLDEEIAALPGQYQAPIVLCYLEGRSYQQAAQELGCPKSTLASRLNQAKELLRQQLVRRGISLSAGVLTAALSEKALAAPVAALLTIKTVKAVASVAAGKAVAGVGLSARAIVLAEEAAAGMIGVKTKVVAMVLALALAAGGAGLAGNGGVAEREGNAQTFQVQSPKAKAETQEAKKKDPPAATDIYGDPLPEGVLARLGTVRYRHGPSTRAIAYSPDGKLLVSAGWSGGGVIVFDANSGKPLRRIAQGKWLQSLAISPDGKTLLLDGTAPTLFDIATGNELRRFEPPGIVRGHYPVVFSPDGKTIASGDELGNAPSIVLWDVETAKVLCTLDGHRGTVDAVAFSPDGKALASGSQDKTVRIWEVATGKELQRLQAQAGSCWTMTFSPSGKVLAMADRDGKINCWDLETGKLQHRLRGDDGLTSSIAFSPDGKRLASGGTSGKIRIWDSSTGKEFLQWQAQDMYLQTITYSPDGKVLASAGTQLNIRRWDPSTGEEINPVAAHNGAVNFLTFAADGKTLYAGDWNRRVLDWKLQTGKVGAQLFDGTLGPTSPGWRMWSADLSADGKMLAVVGANQFAKPEATDDLLIYLWDTVSGKQICSLSGHKTRVNSVLFSVDGKILASRGDDGIIFLWDVEQCKELRHFQAQKPHGKMVVWTKNLAFSSDGKMLITAGDKDQTIAFWENATGRELRRWEKVETDNLILSPDGRLLAFSGNGLRDNLQVWSVEDRKELARFTLPNGESLWSLKFSPNGRIVAIGGASRDNVGKIHLVEVLTGHEIREIGAEQSWVESLTFSSDGRTLASGGGDSTILLWDLTGQARVDLSKLPPLNAKQLDSLWSDLAGDAAIADKAIWTLALTPGPNVAFFKKHMQPAPPPADAKMVAKLIADLDSATFAVRQQAAKALDDLGEAAEPAVRKTLEANPALEVRQRLEQFLQKRNSDLIRKLRAIEALEQIRTPEARQLLDAIGKDSPNPRVSEAAKAALARQAK